MCLAYRRNLRRWSAMAEGQRLLVPRRSRSPAPGQRLHRRPRPPPQRQLRWTELAVRGGRLWERRPACPPRRQWSPHCRGHFAPVRALPVARRTTVALRPEQQCLPHARWAPPRAPPGSALATRCRPLNQPQDRQRVAGSTYLRQGAHPVSAFAEARHFPILDRPHAAIGRTRPSGLQPAERSLPPGSHAVQREVGYRLHSSQRNPVLPLRGQDPPCRYR